MSFKVRQWLSRLARRPSLAGDGLPERMRSTTFALLGITAATCLGLVAVFSQQEWPLLSPGPVPVAPGPAAVGDAAIAAGPSVAEDGSVQRSPQPRVIPVATIPVVVPAPEQDSGSAEITGQLPVPQVSPPGPDGSQPAEPPEPQPTSPAQPLTAAPVATPEQVPVPAPITAPVPPVVASPDLPDDPIDKPGNGHGNGYGHFKSDCHEANDNDEEEQSPTPSVAAPSSNVLAVPEPPEPRAEPEEPTDPAI